MAVAISTSWNAYRFNDGQKLLFEISQLGFKAIELSFNLTSEMVGQIAAAADKSGIQITSLHNYCPIPEGLSRETALPDCYSLASLDEAQRGLALKFSKRSIDTASSLNAKAVVLHLGRVQMPDYTRQLINLYNQGLKDQAEFLELKNKMLCQRQAESAKYLDQALKSLDALNAYAKLKGVLLGVETRFYHREIPDLIEIGIILKKFNNSQIYYWHDTGHAQLMENLGFVKHQDFLEQYFSRLIGIHLHDILGCQDHRAPLEGKIDFAMLKPYLKKDSLKIIEAHYPATAEALIKSYKFISQLFDEAI
ncbi:MAG: TIM barrel protein [Candidatus Omnitrophica bacterium]|nr:TIM barrel protein [Candidatus Omnitrophota bacterium]